MASRSELARATPELLSGAPCLVTGGAGSLGRAIAEALVAAGGRVMLADLDGEAARVAAQAIAGPGDARAIACDVTSGVSVEQAVDATIEAFGPIAVMVNNAGFARDATMRKMSEADFDAVIDVHLKGCWLGTRAAADRMRADGNGGSIVNMSSISGKVGNPGQTNYSAAKAGIDGLTKAAAKELGFTGIRVNAIQPGLVDSPMTWSMPPEVRAARLAEVPLGRFGSPAEVAAAALFLASPLSSYITGAVIEVSGGRNL